MERLVCGIEDGSRYYRAARFGSKSRRCDTHESADKPTSGEEQSFHNATSIQNACPTEKCNLNLPRNDLDFGT